MIRIGSFGVISCPPARKGVTVAATRSENETYPHSPAGNDRLAQQHDDSSSIEWEIDGDDSPRHDDDG